MVKTCGCLRAMQHISRCGSALHFGWVMLLDCWVPGLLPAQEGEALFDYKKLFDLTGKQALVVGAGSGIGEAAAMGLAAHGAHVICGDLNLDGARRVVEAIEASSPGDLERILDRIDEGVSNENAVRTTLHLTYAELNTATADYLRKIH